jgi:hypothetical protein
LSAENNSVKKSSDTDTKVESEDMTKDYNALMLLYKELKVKAEEFHKKYGMLPENLKPLIMNRPGGMRPGEKGDNMMRPGGKDGFDNKGNEENIFE